MKPFNINNCVKVKLNEIGINELRKQHKELEDMGLKGNFVMPEVDKKGYTKYQLHDLMHRFGHLTSIGFGCPFETEILIDL